MIITGWTLFRSQEDLIQCVEALNNTVVGGTSLYVVKLISLGVRARARMERLGIKKPAESNSKNVNPDLLTVMYVTRMTKLKLYLR